MCECEVGNVFACVCAWAIVLGVWIFCYDYMRVVFVWDCGPWNSFPDRQGGHRWLSCMHFQSVDYVRNDSECVELIDKKLFGDAKNMNINLNRDMK